MGGGRDRVAVGDPPAGVGHDDPVGDTGCSPARSSPSRAGSTFLYFLQPTIGGIFLAAAFLVSVVINRPLARRFAGDFCKLPRASLSDGRVHRFFRRISLMWGAVGLANAAAGFWLLTTQSTNVYVIASTVLSIGVTAAAVAASAVWFRRTVAHVS